MVVRENMAGFQSLKAAGLKVEVQLSNWNMAKEKVEQLNRSMFGLGVDECLAIIQASQQIGRAKSFRQLSRTVNSNWHEDLGEKPDPKALANKLTELASVIEEKSGASAFTGDFNVGADPIEPSGRHACVSFGPKQNALFGPVGDKKNEALALLVTGLFNNLTLILSALASANTNNQEER